MTVGVFTHQSWQELLALKQPTCKQKEDLAYRITKKYIPLDGSTANGYVTTNERNWHHPVMYYMALMDCDDQFYMMFGDNKYGRLEVTATMTQDDSHFSYENQSCITTDAFLMLVFFVLFFLYFRDCAKF